MSAAMQSGLNGRFKKSLAYQLDRLDAILDGLAEALNGAVAGAVKQAVGEAVKVAVAEVMSLQATLPKPHASTAQRLFVQAKSKAKQLFNRTKEFFASACQKIMSCCTRFTSTTVQATRSAWAKVRSRSIRMGILLGAVASCVMALFRKESQKLWWGAGIVLSTMLLESCFGTMGTLLLGGGVVYLVLQHRAFNMPRRVAAQRAA